MATQKKFVVKNGLIASDLSYPTSDGTANQSLVTDGAGNLSFGTLSTSTVTEGSNLYYTDARADARVALIVDAAPSTLDTLNELAAALGDDANFSTTVTNSIANKLPLAGGTMTGDIDLGDNIKASFGASNNLEIYHNGYLGRPFVYATAPLFIASTGNIWIGGDSIGLGNPGSSEYFVQCVNNGEVKLYYDNAEKLATTSTGLDVTGNASFANNGKAIFGASNNLQIFSTGTSSYVAESGSGDLYIKGSSIYLTDTDNNQYIHLSDTGTGGTVVLKHNAVTKLATTATGIDVTGTTTTDQYLYVNSPNGTQLQLRSEDAYTTLGVGNRNLNISANRTIFLDDAFAEKMRINDDGNVGIGISSPGYKLEVAGTTRVTSMTGNATGGGAGLESRYSTSGNWGGLLSYNRSYASYQELRLEGSTIKIIESGETTPTFTVNDSKVGIGTTSPSSALNVVGANNSTLVEFDVGASAKFNFGANSTSLYTTSFYIDNTGLDIGCLLYTSPSPRDS